MKRFLPILLVLSLGTVSNARPIRPWTYAELTKEAEIIVIATPTAVRDTQEQTTIPGIQRADGAGGPSKPIPAIGVETTFEVLSILKGGNELKTFVFYHLRESNPPPSPGANAAQLVSFEPKDKMRYLLFMKRDADGRYSSLAGQTDPGMAVPVSRCMYGARSFHPGTGWVPKEQEPTL